MELTWRADDALGHNPPRQSFPEGLHSGVPARQARTDRTGGIWLAVELANMRGGPDRPVVLVATHLGENPANGCRYAFVNHRQTMVEVPGFGPGGLLLRVRHLERDMFALFRPPWGLKGPRRDPRHVRPPINRGPTGSHPRRRRCLPNH